PAVNATGRGSKGGLTGLGLPVYPGFACIWLGCLGYLMLSWKWLRMHFNNVHGAKVAKRKTGEDLWTAVYL
ncbi:hypothetical protein LB507_008913, partial [Fusarium sp. FIESC RH6]